jgi:hypothetical protein
MAQGQRYTYINPTQELQLQRSVLGFIVATRSIRHQSIDSRWSSTAPRKGRGASAQSIYFSCRKSVDAPTPALRKTFEVYPCIGSMAATVALENSVRFQWAQGHDPCTPALRYSLQERTCIEFVVMGTPTLTSYKHFQKAHCIESINTAAKRYNGPCQLHSFEMSQGRGPPHQPSAQTSA